jgi:hypothetical protein
MGKKAKQKKMRKQGQAPENQQKEYDSTQFVRQFEQMGYQLLPKPRSRSQVNQSNFPEIPQDKIEPQI